MSLSKRSALRSKVDSSALDAAVDRPSIAACDDDDGGFIICATNCEGASLFHISDALGVQVKFSGRPLFRCSGGYACCGMCFWVGSDSSKEKKINDRHYGCAIICDDRHHIS